MESDDACSHHIPLGAAASVSARTPLLQKQATMCVQLLRSKKSSDVCCYFCHANFSSPTGAADNYHTTHTSLSRALYFHIIYAQ